MALRFFSCWTCDVILKFWYTTYIYTARLILSTAILAVPLSEAYVLLIE